MCSYRHNDLLNRVYASQIEALRDENSGERQSSGAGAGWRWKRRSRRKKKRSRRSRKSRKRRKRRKRKKRKKRRKRRREARAPSSFLLSEQMHAW